MKTKTTTDSKSDTKATQARTAAAKKYPDDSPHHYVPYPLRGVQADTGQTPETQKARVAAAKAARLASEKNALTEKDYLAQHAKVNALQRKSAQDAFIRAKMIVFEVTNESGTTDKVRLQCLATGDNALDNNYSMANPASCLDIQIDNPFLRGLMKRGQKFFIDISPAE